MIAVLRHIHALVLVATLAVATTWDHGLDGQLLGDLPAPTPTPAPAELLYELSRRASIPITKHGSSSHKGNRLNPLARLERRQEPNCQDGFVPTCEAGSPFCCPSTHPVCCPEPSENCCLEGLFCASVTVCCTIGETLCGEGCCAAGSTCCGNTQCCSAGFQCRNNECINPALSSQSLLSQSSVASVSSVSVSSQSVASQGAASSLSSASVASLSSELAQQDRGDADPNAINTVQVFPSDERIKYNPQNLWADTSTAKGVGVCNNGTRVTTSQGASFSFVFSGTSISLFTVPRSSSAGDFTVQIDANAVEKVSQGAQASAQCAPSSSFTRNNLAEGVHKIVVIAVTGIELNMIQYTGRGAFGSDVSGSNNDGGDNRAAIIGASVGGVVGALALVGLTVFLFLKHKNKNKNKSAGPTPMLGSPPPMQNQFSHPVSPQPYNPNGSLISGAHSPNPSMYYAGNGIPTGMSSGFPQQQSPSPPWAQPHPYGPPGGPVAPAPHNLAPLPMWVDRSAATPATMSSGDTRYASPPIAPLATSPHPQAPYGYGNDSSRPNSLHDPRYYTSGDAYGGMAQGHPQPPQQNPYYGQ